ncbi:hypothetical protein [Nocardioides sp. AN3]
MRTINRRTFNQEVSRVVNQVIETGEAVKVVGRDGRAVLVSPAPVEETKQERWDRLVRSGQIELKQHDPEALARLPVMRGVDLDAVMADMEEDR